MNRDTPEKIFEDDEMCLLEPVDFHSLNDLESKSGIAFFKDVSKVLNIDSPMIKKHHSKLVNEHSEKEAYRIMGVKKIWNHWIVRLKIFIPYYKANFLSDLKEVAPKWDSNQVLEQKGTFRLSDVCQKLPFSAHQIRYQARQEKASKEKMGIWKDEELKIYLVDMETFSSWITKLWKSWSE